MNYQNYFIEIQYPTVAYIQALRGRLLYRESLSIYQTNNVAILI